VAVRLEYAELDEEASVEVQWRMESANDTEYYHKITQAVAASDVAIVVLGEAIQEVGEGKDRQNLNLKQTDIDMLQAVVKGGKPVVSVLLNGRPLVLTPVEAASSAMLEAWFPGENGGNAVVDVLFGDYNPSGKLTVSLPQYQGQLPIYYSKKPSSPRGYTDGTGEPLFPFGHGLSYSAFEYSNLKIEGTGQKVQGTGQKVQGEEDAPFTFRLSPSTQIKVTLDVTNIGSVDGTETVQLYVRDKTGSVATPAKALKGFSQIYLKAGETQKVTINISPEEHLWLINLAMKRVVEPGEFEFMIGSSSSDIRFRETIILK
jgi:beta-glucosidase